MLWSSKIRGSSVLPSNGPLCTFRLVHQHILYLNPENYSSTHLFVANEASMPVNTNPHFNTSVSRINLHSRYIKYAGFTAHWKRHLVICFISSRTLYRLLSPLHRGHKVVQLLRFCLYWHSLLRAVNKGYALFSSRLYLNVLVFIWNKNVVFSSLQMYGGVRTLNIEFNIFLNWNLDKQISMHVIHPLWLPCCVLFRLYVFMAIL